MMDCYRWKSLKLIHVFSYEFFWKKNESLKANKFGPHFFPNVSTLVELNIVEYSNLIFLKNRTFFFLSQD